MTAINFNNDENLGKVVDGLHPFSHIDPRKTITNISQITTKLSGNKYSCLCGFKFNSIFSMDELIHNSRGKARSFEPSFYVVYVPKLKSFSHSHGQSGWYLWQPIAGSRERAVMTAQAIFDIYKFDVDKFFQSDAMNKYVVFFKTIATAALHGNVQKFIDLMQTDRSLGDVNEVKRYVKSIEDSLKTIDSLTRTSTAKLSSGQTISVVNANLAYNTNAGYVLPNYKDIEDREKTSIEQSREFQKKYNVSDDKAHANAY